MLRARALVCAVAAATAVSLSACGGGGVSSDDPASLAPADAPIYVQAVVRPQGKQKSDVESLASTISGLADPTGRLIDLINQGLNQNPPLSGKHLTFQRDIEPWLGDRAGIFVEGFNHAPGAGILQTTDPKASEKFIQDSRQKGDRERSYRGVRYLLSSGTAVAVVGDFLVVGDQPAFKDAVDVSKGADSLGDQGDFNDALDHAPSGSLLDVYASLEGIDKAIRANDAGNAAAFEGTVGETAGKTVLASLVPHADSAELDIATNAESRSLRLADSSNLIRDFPAAAFAAIAEPDVGETIKATLAQLQRAGVPGVSKQAIDQRLAPAGITLDDITGALGDAAIFAEGSDLRSLQAAAAIVATDPGKASDLVGNLASLALSGGGPGVSKAPVGNGFEVRTRSLGRQPLVITSQDGRVVIGYGEQATRQAFSQGGAGTLGGDPTFKQAQQALGGSTLAGYVSLPKVFQLADALGALHSSGYVQARPYLDKLTYAVIGSGTQGDFQSLKVIVGVRG